MTPSTSISLQNQTFAARPSACTTSSSFVSSPLIACRRVNGYYVIGNPVMIQGSKYPRNYLLFNMVCHPALSVHSVLTFPCLLFSSASSYPNEVTLHLISLSSRDSLPLWRASRCPTAMPPLCLLF